MTNRKPTLAETPAGYVPQRGIAYIALGSNQGDRLASLRRALAMIGNSSGIRVDPCGVASLWETAPVGGEPGQSPYYNSAVRLFTRLDAPAILEILLNIESSLGRTRTQRNESRLIDLDLLLFDSMVVQEGNLVVPHPRMQDRRFVLEPLAEIAIDLRHPVLNRTVGELCDRLRHWPDQWVQKVMGPEWAGSLD